MKFSLKALIEGKIVLVSTKEQSNTYSLMGIHEHILFYHDKYDTLVLYDRKENSLKEVNSHQYSDFKPLDIDRELFKDRLKEIDFLKKRYHLEQLIKSTKSYINLDNVIDLMNSELKADSPDSIRLRNIIKAYLEETVK